MCDDLITAVMMKAKIRKTILYGNNILKPAFSKPPNQGSATEIRAPDSMGVTAMARVIEVAKMPVSEPIRSDFVVSRKNG